MSGLVSDTIVIERKPRLPQAISGVKKTIIKNG